MYKMTIFIGLKNIDNKKAQHPVGLFYIFDALGITPVVPLTFPCSLVYFYCLEHPALYVSIIRNRAESVYWQNP